MDINLGRDANKVTMKSAYKFRAYPSQSQRSNLNGQMYLSKEMYNLLLDESKRYYKETKKTLTEYRMNVWLTKMKKERPEFKELHSQVLQNIPKRVSEAYGAFFRRAKAKKSGKKVKVGFPRYKKFVSSLTFPQEGGFIIGKKKVRLSKIGNINFVNHREIGGTPKTCTIKKTKTDEWFVIISTERADKIPFSNGKSAVGIDLGIKQYATLSDGSVLQNWRIPNRVRNGMKRLQKIISRRKKGSHKRRKAVLRFSRKCEHISRIREDDLHKLTQNLVNSYSFIAYEELEIANMMKNHRLARNIGEESWGKFAQLLQYKAESAGCVVVAVNPRNTSKTCSECGNVQDISLDERTFTCNNCGMSRNRDLNASINILERATSGQEESHASGDGVRPSTMRAVVVERGTIFGGAS